MELYLLRHGIAEDLKPGQKDSDRALTAEGIRKLRIVLKKARSSGVAPDRIVTSPYRRALQTAEIAAAELKHKGELVRSNSLTPDSSPESAWAEIRLHKGVSQLLLAGHEPLFSSLTAYLLNSPALVVDFKKGAIVRIDLDASASQPRGVLKWMLSAKVA